VTHWSLRNLWVTGFIGAAEVKPAALDSALTDFHQCSAAAHFFLLVRPFAGPVRTSRYTVPPLMLSQATDDTPEMGS